MLVQHDHDHDGDDDDDGAVWCMAFGGRWVTEVIQWWYPLYASVWCVCCTLVCVDVDAMGVV